MTPLAEKLVGLIHANGPLTVAEYMAACLGDPKHGYYQRAAVFGRDGDFITAPEISQVFGELIGAWVVATWQAMGSPARCALLELGPGRGTLMADILRTARVRPNFGVAAEVHFLETSPRLREAQRAALKGRAATWHDYAGSLPQLPTIAVANEFFDALPVHQFVRSAGQWGERVVGIGEDGGLAFGLRPITFPSGSPFRVPSAELAQRLADSRESLVVESCPAGGGIMTTLALRIAVNGGAALVIDYGYEGPAFGETLQAVRQHRYDDPLAAPGEADLTAHVDFAALARAAAAAGASPRKPIGQGALLGRLGLAERVAALTQGKDEAAAAVIAAGADRLSSPAAMGDLFRVLAVSAPDLVLPAFDDPAPTPA